MNQESGGVAGREPGRHRFPALWRVKGAQRLESVRPGRHRRSAATDKRSRTSWGGSRSTAMAHHGADRTAVDVREVDAGLQNRSVAVAVPAQGDVVRTLAAWHRPFGSTDEMDEHLLHEWRRRVQTGDTVICLERRRPSSGLAAPLDGAGPARVSWRAPADTRQPRRLRHRSPAGGGFHRPVRVRAVRATEPPLALTHVPLRRVPPTAINVHGHLHGAPAPTPRHSTSAWNGSTYAPVHLD